MKKSLIITGFLMVLATSSCKYKTENNIKEEVMHYMGKKIELPNIKQTLYQDSLLQVYDKLKDNEKLKVVTLLWGDCHSCLADIKKWNELYQHISNNKKVNLHYYLFTSDIDFFRENYYNSTIYDFHLLLDPENQYLIKNNLPLNNKLYQTFLLDSNNKIILVGNPIYSIELMELYKEEIEKRLEE